MKLWIGSAPARLLARVAPDRAVERRRGLEGGVRDEVAGRRAATLERVEQPEPVAHLVGAGVPFAVQLQRATRQAAVVDDDAVEEPRQPAILRREVRGEVGPAEQELSEGGAVEVQRPRVALVQRLLHLHLFAA